MTPKRIPIPDEPRYIERSHVCRGCRHVYSWKDLQAYESTNDRRKIIILCHDCAIAHGHTPPEVRHAQ